MNGRRRTAWDAALAIVKVLRSEGHTALLAGGCVRDMLLGTTPKDYDVATDAHPGRVTDLFPRARRVGAKFGVILVRKYGHDVEVATFRSEGRYSDGRHPDDVTFGSAEKDARRRDFTINGLFFDPLEDRIIDYVCGRDDLGRKVIRTIGDPQARFDEDHLRMLRAVRFAARLGFSVDAATKAAIQQLAPHLSRISPERVWQELEMILTHPSRTAGWSLLVGTGLCNHLVAGWGCDPPVCERIRRRLEGFPPEEVRGPAALAALWCDEPAERVAALARGLRLSNRDSDALVWMVRSVGVLRTNAEPELADLKLLMAHSHWLELLTLLRADELASSGQAPRYGRLRDRANAIPADRVAPRPLLTGNDLLAMGARPGPHLGRMLDTLYREQLNERIGTRDEADRLAKELMSTGDGQ